MLVLDWGLGCRDKPFAIILEKWFYRGILRMSLYGGGKLIINLLLALLIGASMMEMYIRR